MKGLCLSNGLANGSAKCLALLLTLALTACGGGGIDDPDEGAAPAMGTMPVKCPKEPVICR